MSINELPIVSAKEIVALVSQESRGGVEELSSQLELYRQLLALKKSRSKVVAQINQFTQGSYVNSKVHNNNQQLCQDFEIQISGITAQIEGYDLENAQNYITIPVLETRIKELEATTQKS